MDGAEASYLSDVDPHVRDQLADANRAGLAAWQRYIDDGAAIAFLGAGVSAPLYPLWTNVIDELIEAAVDRLSAREALTLQRLAVAKPSDVVDTIQEMIGDAPYQTLLRGMFGVRYDADNRSWTPTQELVCRLAFRAVVTTNYDPGILRAKQHVRAGAPTGFASWRGDRADAALEDWITGDVLAGSDELPILFAHGYHGDPESIVLAESKYSEAYGGKLRDVVTQLVRTRHLVWLGFSFSDDRIGSILRRVGEMVGPADAPVTPRHVAVMPWDPAEERDPGVLVSVAHRAYRSSLVLYPTPEGDHSALLRLLQGLADGRAAADNRRAGMTGGQRAGNRPIGLNVDASASVWVHETPEVAEFAGRSVQIGYLDQWAAESSVRVIGVTAWGGVGKTTLVNRWLSREEPLDARGFHGVFGWSFYVDQSAQRWANALLKWAGETHQYFPTGVQLEARVLDLLAHVPLILVLDGLEVIQDDPAEEGYGRLTDGLLRDLVVGACQRSHGSLLVLTSRFPFADLSGFDGSAARMLDLPPLTVAEGATLFEAAGVTWLTDEQKRGLVDEVGGHALAVSAMASLLALDRDEHGPAIATDLMARLGDAGAQQKVNRVLKFYADRLSPDQRALVAVVASFNSPRSPDQLLRVLRDERLGDIGHWDVNRIRSLATGPLAGLLTYHSNDTLSAHPVVRGVFKPFAVRAGQSIVDATLTGSPRTTISTREEALQLVEAIEQALDTGGWERADELYRERTAASRAWIRLPAVLLGRRAAAAFVGRPERQAACERELSWARMSFYLNEVGVLASLAAEMRTARRFLEQGVRSYREEGGPVGLSFALRNRAECLATSGRIQDAAVVADEAYSRAIKGDSEAAVITAVACRAWIADLAGDTAKAEQLFLEANRLERDADPDVEFLYSLDGVRWARFLGRTARIEYAAHVNRNNLVLCERSGWAQDVARCKLVQVELADLDDSSSTTPEATEEALADAIACFRDGVYQVDLADALIIAAAHARTREASDAERYLDRAIGIAGPNDLVPLHAQALSTRAEIAGARYRETGDESQLHGARDAGMAAVRLSTMGTTLPWQELRGTEALAALGADAGLDDWAAKARGLRARLVPGDLPSVPLSTSATAPR